MTYKDPEKQREYQRQWQWNKRRKLNTNLKGKISTKYLSILEKEIRRKQIRKICHDNQQIKRRNIKIKYLGDCCKICKINYINNKRVRMVSHKKDGAPHKNLVKYTNQEFLDAMKSGEFVLLCSLCHKRVHWLMQYFNFSWEQIENFLNTNSHQHTMTYQQPPQ